ncbi:helix-turn-helix domain-containing protein [Sphingobium subterraneum]|uniref:AraC-like DNA-binding protein n=1 Tax=Sphingobium subterraneum TaxID=627688 RepID=A0A841J1X5_9SPHN|nr:helix-turn-helix domain-containing protein [Sphingobium subterraneum]MBB6124704.1 AraC-like DNA-binding protein [Sphingobium subterraneum]
MYHNYPDNTEEGFVGLRYWVPPEHLRNFFGSVYLFTVKRPQYSDLTRADMPQLRFMLSGSGHYTFHDGREAATPKVCMVGPTMGATRFQLDSPSVVFGTSFLPLGWMALGCESADRWIDSIYDVIATHGPQFQDMLDMMRAERDPDIIVERLWQFLESQLRPIPAGVETAVAAIDAWLSDESSPQVDRLVAASGLSARQVARTTNRLYGAPPKLLARKYRALRCASQIVIDKKSWVDLCEEGTFYDQPHFIREIKQFIGLTPHQLMNDPTDVARLTVQRRALTGLVAEINRIS